MVTKKILWIDDMISWSSSVQYNLSIIADAKEVNLICLSKPNGEDIVQTIMQFDFDLVVMDFHMSPFNGDKYIRDIRFEEHLECIPIIFYSQDTDTDLNSLIREFRDVEVVYRPYLEDKIREILGF